MAFRISAILADYKVQGMIIRGSSGSEVEVNFVGVETDEDL